MPTESNYIKNKDITENKVIFTIGYESLKTEDFIARLKENDIEILVDVREIPWSRKRDFSKSQLENLIGQYDIKYIHIQKFGSPSVLRKKVREDNNYKQFFIEYKNYLKTQIDELRKFHEILEKSVCCLMCFEKNVEICHRKIIVSEIKKLHNNGLKIIHL